MQWSLLPWFLVAFVGVLLIANAEKSPQENETNNTTEDGTQKNVSFGIAMALLSALTETLIFLVVKTSVRKNPFMNILTIYPAAFAGLLA